MRFHSIRIPSCAGNWNREPAIGSPYDQRLIIFSSGIVDFT
jgi:hypothetical protein